MLREILLQKLFSAIGMCFDENIKKEVCYLNKIGNYQFISTLA